MRKYAIPILCLIVFIFAFGNYFNHHGYPVFSFQKEHKIIVIDVGHGGNDPGKVSANGIEEKDVNLEIAKYLRDYLIAQDYIVYLTRDTDCGLYDEGASNKKSSDLKNRVQFFKDKQATLVVSIHQNSFSDPLQHGAQAFYFSKSESSQQLAQSIQNSLVKIDPSNTRTEKASDTYYLLKNSSMPAVIVECGFLSNAEETAKLTDSNYQKKLAYAISLGICSYEKGQKQ